MMPYSRRSLLLGLPAGIAVSALGTTPGVAQERELRIGLSGAISSVDPHFAVLSSNQALSLHFFDGLVRMDNRFRPQPGLALSWRAIEPQIWEFQLRPDVRFSNGSPFGAEDVVASIERAPDVPNSPSSFRTYTNSIERVEAAGPLTVRIHTNRRNPLLPADLSAVMIIPKALRNTPTAEFNAGPGMIGTGPYRMVDYTPGSQILMERNPHYWGEAEPWSRVTARIISNNAARTAGLLAGDLDLIDNVGPADMPRLKGSSRHRVVDSVSNRVIFLMLDHGNAVSPDITDRNGQRLQRNPLQDLRVRQALSLAINRSALVERIMEGQAVPAGQLLPDGFNGVSSKLGVPPYDPAQARRLLTEAGYPDGFRLVLRGPNNRYLNDASTLQAIAQMFSRIGIASTVEAAPWVAFRPLIGSSSFSVALFGWASNTGETGLSMNALLGTKDAALGRGVPNGGQYSNARLDTLIEEAMGTIDDNARGALLAEATELAMQDVALIPLLYAVSTWACRNTLQFDPPSNEYTTAMRARPA
jgi:peptide/nickel transport system substrate-binding protein